MDDTGTNVKPNCHDCKHRRRSMLGAHSACAHPKSGLNQDDGMGGLCGVARMMLGLDGPPAYRELGITGHPHGVFNGWFSWPADFDPCWLLSCNGFEPIPKEVSDGTAPHPSATA